MSKGDQSNIVLNVVNDFFNEYNSQDFNWNVSKGPVEMKNCHNEIYKDSYLFHKQSNFVKKLLSEFNNNESETPITKNIGIIGGRGSGKTSFLLNLKKAIEVEDYFVLDIIDPNILGSSINIMEILVSLIYGEITREEWIDLSNDDVLINQANILKELKEISKTLVNLRKKTGYFKESNPTIDILEDLHIRINFNNQFKNLIKNFKQFINDTRDKQIKDVILMIDDLDLIKNKSVYEMLNDIQKFLNGNIILFLSYREKQLIDTVLEQKILENKILMDRNQIDFEDIKSQTTNMINKLIPYNNRVDLNINNESLMVESFLYEVLKKDKHKIIDGLERINIDEFFIESILYKTNLPIEPIDMKEYTKYIFPENLRGKLQLFELIVKEMEYDRDKKLDEIEPYEIYNKNLKIFKKYFYSEINSIISNKNLGIIENWIDKPDDKKNYYMYKVLFEEINNNKEIIKKVEDSLLDIDRMEFYNVCLGDVYDILEIYKDENCKNEIDYYYVYVIKMMYSIELLENFLAILCLSKKSKDIEEINKHKNKYFKLINGKLMPDRIEYCKEKFKKSLILKYNEKEYKENENQYKKEDGEEEKEERKYKEEKNKYKELISKIHYTDIPEKGNIAKNTRPGINENIDSKQLRYRQYFNYGELGSTWVNNKLTNNSNYKTDPYSFLVKERYIDDYIDNFDNHKDMYIFYSIFDIDIFNRIIYANYTQNTTDSKLIYQIIVEKINKFIGDEDESDKDINIEIEKKLKYRIKKNKFKMYKNKGIERESYEEPYSPTDIGVIKEILPNRYNDGKPVIFLSNEDLKSKIDKGNITESLDRSIKVIKEINNIIEENTYVSREELEIFLNSEMQRKVRSNIVNTESTSDDIAKLYDTHLNKKGLQDKISLRDKGVDISGKNNFMYLIYVILISDKLSNIDCKDALEEYLSRLAEEIHLDRSIKTKQQKSLIFIMLALGISDFNTDLYEYKE